MNVQEGLLALVVAALGGYRDTRGHVLVLMAVIYCDERMQRKVSQGESTQSEIPGKSGPNSKGPSSRGVTQEELNSSSP